MIPLAMSTRGKFSKLMREGKRGLTSIISEIATDSDMNFEYHPRQKFPLDTGYKVLQQYHKLTALKGPHTAFHLSLLFESCPPI